MRDRRSGTDNLRVAAATVVLGFSALTGLATAAPAAAITPAADLDTLDIVPPEPAPAPIAAPVRLIEAHVTVAPTPNAAAASPHRVVPTDTAESTNAPGRPAGTVEIGEADTVERDDVATTVTLRIEVPAPAAATRTVTVRSADDTILAGPFPADGRAIEVHDLAAGDVDIYVEDRATDDGGGSTLARTPATLTAGRTHVARCDGESLECTVD